MIVISSIAGYPDNAAKEGAALEEVDPLRVDEIHKWDATAAQIQTRLIYIVTNYC